MKKTFKILALACIFSITFVSCFEDYLDPVPQTSLAEELAFDTRSRVEGQVNGLYAAAKSGEYLGGRYIVYNEIRGNDFLNLRTNGVTGYQTWTHNLATTTNEVQNLWGQIYLMINRVNVFLEGMEDNRANILSTNILTEAEFNQYVGEAHALRGMGYFHLAMLYAQPYNKNPQALGLVLRTSGSRDQTGNDMARSTITQTYDLIISDLNRAVSLLPARHGTGTANNVLNVTRFQRNSALALLTRVHLHKNDYAAVLTEGNKIVSQEAPFIAGEGVEYRLAANFATVFAAPYTSSESMFSIPMTDTELPGTQNQLGHYFSIPPAGNQEYNLNPAGPAWSDTITFPGTDARRALTATAVLAGETNRFINKYPRFPHVDYVPVIRYAEVLLNLAEAEARVNGVNGRAVALFNAVHSRSNPGVEYAVADFASADAFVDRLLHERNMEFLGEGIRNMDITRKIQPFGAKANVPTIDANSNRYVWPIPQTEFNTNNLVQPN